MDDSETKTVLLMATSFVPSQFERSKISAQGLAVPKPEPLA